MSHLGYQAAGFRSRASARARRAFTFTEVLFAVMLLGIGFIMVAAIFPVAIRESRANRDDTTGVIVAKAGARIMSMKPFSFAQMTIGSRKDLHSGPVTRVIHRVWPFTDYASAGSPKLYSAIREELISRSDPRYAWAPLGYKLLPPVPQSSDSVNAVVGYEVYVVAVACRNKAGYDEDDLNGPDGFGSTFIPKQVCFTLSEGDRLDVSDPKLPPILISGPDFLRFSDPLDPNRISAREEEAAADGAYVIVADDQIDPDPNKPFSGLAGMANGRIYRLSVKRDDLGPGIWELAPGRDMYFNPKTGYSENLPPRDIKITRPITGKPAIGLMIGRGYVDPTAPRDSRTGRLACPLEGPAQDLFAMPVMVFYP